jgi:hypothetical protein
MFRDHQWIVTDSAYYALLAQGYITAQIQKRHGVSWRLMVLQ